MVTPRNIMDMMAQEMAFRNAQQGLSLPTTPLGSSQAWGLPGGMNLPPFIPFTSTAQPAPSPLPALTPGNGGSGGIPMLSALSNLGPIIGPMGNLAAGALPAAAKVLDMIQGATGAGINAASSMTLGDRLAANQMAPVVDRHVEEQIATATEAELGGVSGPGGTTIPTPNAARLKVERWIRDNGRPFDVDDATQWNELFPSNLFTISAELKSQIAKDANVFWNKMRAGDTSDGPIIGPTGSLDEEEELEEEPEEEGDEELITDDDPLSAFFAQSEELDQRISDIRAEIDRLTRQLARETDPNRMATIERQLTFLNTALTDAVTESQFRRQLEFDRAEQASRLASQYGKGELAQWGQERFDLEKKDIDAAIAARIQEDLTRELLGLGQLEQQQLATFMNAVLEAEALNAQMQSEQEGRSLQARLAAAENLHRMQQAAIANPFNAFAMTNLGLLEPGGGPFGGPAIDPTTGAPSMPTSPGAGALPGAGAGALPGAGAGALPGASVGSWLPSLDKLGFRVPENIQPGVNVPMTDFFPNLPTLGGYLQAGDTAQGLMESFLRATGTSAKDQARGMGSVTPATTALDRYMDRT